MKRNFDPERIRGFHVDHEFELCRAHNRKVCWALALEHTAGDAAELLVGVDEAGTVAHETTRQRKFADVVDRRYAMPSSERDERVALTVDKGSPWTTSAPACSLRRVSKAAAKSGVRLDRSTTKRRPSACAATWTSSAWALALGLSGLTSSATRFAPGTISRMMSRRLLPRALVMRLIPVALPWGLLKLATSPARIGSSAIMKTIGIVPAAAFAAAADGSPPVTRTDTGSRASSATNAPRRSLRPPAQRYSTWTLRSSAYPARSRPRRKAAL